MTKTDDSKVQRHHSSFADAADECDDEIEMFESPRKGQPRRLDIDRAACRTQQSHRRFLIQMASDLASDRMRDPVRRNGSFGRDRLPGRVNDWD
jgi:hypothetical protein